MLLIAYICIVGESRILVGKLNVNQGVSVKGCGSQTSTLKKNNQTADLWMAVFGGI